MSKLLQVNDLTTEFTGDFGKKISVDHVSFDVAEGETVCIVGESGCGKSVTSLSIMGLLGRVKQLDTIRGNQMTMIFQDPLTSLNPVFTIGSQITESIRIHMHLSKKEAGERAVTILEKVGMPDARAAMKKYPHMLSGGMRQRVMIAMALCCNPKLLIADEPTTALDVTIQAQIMELIRDLQKEIGMSVILITHDIGLVAQMADRVFVMYAGQIIEMASVKDLFYHPAHPYTKALLDTVPGIYDESGRTLASIPGIVPENYDQITGCRFADRCAFAGEGCEKKQEMREIEKDHFVRCHKADRS